MATLKTAYFSGSNGSHFYIRLDYSLTQSTANNSSTITYELWLCSQDGYSGSGSGGVEGFINGELVGKPTYIGVNSSVKMGSKTETIYHNQDGTKTITYSASATSHWSNITSASLSGNLTLPKIDRYPMLTTASNFNDEENPIITFTTTSGFNNATYSACISLTGQTDNVPYRTIDISNGTYTFELTNEERTTLRNATPNSNNLNVIFFLRTTANGQNYYSTLSATMSIINANPTFTPTMIETNQNVRNVFGDSATNIVQDVSQIATTITPVAYKGASITRVEIVNRSSDNSRTYILDTSPYQVTIPAIGSNFQVYVLDSRGNSVTTPINKTLVPYIPIKINSFNFERYNPTSSNIIVNLDSTYFETTGVTNTPVVEWKLDDGSYTTIPSTEYLIDTTNNKLTISNYELTNALVYTSKGTFGIRVSDIFTSASNSLDVNKGIPTMDLGEHDLQVNGDIIVADTDGENGVSVATKVSITTDGSAVKTGRIIDGHEEYVKRYYIPTPVQQNPAYWVSSGLQLSQINIIKIEGTIVSTTNGNTFSVQNPNYNGGYVYCYYNGQYDRIGVNCSTQNYQSTGAYVNLYFTYKNS